jgi:hypothetical protein
VRVAALTNKCYRPGRASDGRPSDCSPKQLCAARADNRASQEQRQMLELASIFVAPTSESYCYFLRLEVQLRACSTQTAKRASIDRRGLKFKLPCMSTARGWASVPIGRAPLILGGSHAGRRRLPIRRAPCASIGRPPARSEPMDSRKGTATAQGLSPGPPRRRLGNPALVWSSKLEPLSPHLVSLSLCRIGPNCRIEFRAKAVKVPCSDA